MKNQNEYFIILSLAAVFHYFDAASGNKNFFY